MMAAHEPRELSSEEEGAAAGDDLRRGPWTVEEDLLLVNYIDAHGEGRWNALARCAGLKRTGKSCRLRWLNYLRPDVRRGNMTAQEQLLILELHARWGNRWSKIAQHLPGRTDNEIKNYWRTRVQKHAKHLNCDVNSQQFKDLMRYLWMPRLLERIRSDDADLSASCTTVSSSSASTVDGGGAQLLSPPPPQPPPLAVAESSNVDDCILMSNDAAAMCQLAPQAQMSSDPTTTVTQLPACQPQFDHQFGWAETSCCWSESLPGVYDDMGLPDFDMGGVETMWGSSCADDPWYTQMLGL